MGCFLACFGGSKDNKRKQQRNRVIPRDQRHGNYVHLRDAVISSERHEPKKTITQFLQLRDEPEEETRSNVRKKVTFDSAVTTYDYVSVHESTESLLASDREFDEEKEEILAKSNEINSQLEEEDFTSCKYSSYPSNHRYRNCRESDDEIEDLDDKDCDVNDECGTKEECGDNVIGEMRIETSSSLALPDHKEANIVDREETARDRSNYVHPVLNPVENLSQWKAVKSKGTLPLKPQKENFNAKIEDPVISVSPEFTSKRSSLISKPENDGHGNHDKNLAVDASLSNWLVSDKSISTKRDSFAGFQPVTPEKTMSQVSHWAKSHEDRPILGALTVEELKQSTTPSPRKSPSSRSPDEAPIIGTVGTYWQCTDPAKDDCGSASSFNGIPNTTSKYQEDKRVSWHNTPFEVRLERALNRGAAEA